MVKIDSTGNKQWDKDFGGTNGDWLYSIQQTSNGGYILGGISLSGINGDKTETIWGAADYWIVKTDSLGNKQWDKDFGGISADWLSTVRQASDGGFILAGYSLSGISGNKTHANWGFDDYWIVKIDSFGNKQWDNVYGGIDDEEEGNISLTADGGYLISGTSYSPISGNKTENNFGEEQTWVVKIDSLGIKKWDKTMLTTGHDERGLAIQTKDGCYTIANYTSAGIGAYKTQPNWDTTNLTYDYWIIKFCDTTLTTNSPTLTLSEGEGAAIAPNPFSEKLNITANNNTLSEIILYDIASRKLLHQKFTSSVTLNTDQLAKGIYIYEVRSNEGVVKIGKVVKQ
jgi:hypothetical protein